MNLDVFFLLPHCCVRKEKAKASEVATVAVLLSWEGAMEGGTSMRLGKMMVQSAM